MDFKALLKGPWPYVVVGGSGLGIFLLWRHDNAKKTAAAASAGVAGTSAYGYGSAVNSYGYGSGSEPYGYSAYTYEPFGYGGNYGYGSFGSGVSEVAPTQVVTNAQWVQAAAGQLGNTAGYSGASVIPALSAYSLGQPVTPAQEQYVTAGIGVEGYPPVPGPGGYPPAIKTTTGGGGTGQTSNVTVPKTVGMTQEDAFRLLQDEGLKPTGSKTITGKTLTVQSSTPAAGTSVKKGSTVKLTSKVVK